MEFPCNACGECCRHVGGEPRLDRGDGTCRHFDEQSRLCGIYATRPLYCSVDRSYAAWFEGKVAPTVFYLVQAASCVALSAANADVLTRTRAALEAENLFDAQAPMDVEAVRRIGAMMLAPAADTA